MDVVLDKDEELLRKDSSTQTSQELFANSTQHSDLNIICRKCLKEINYRSILAHDKRCNSNKNTCSKCNLVVDVNRLERHNLIECKFSDYCRRVEIQCPVCLDNLVEIGEKQRKITPCGHFVCLECAKQSITLKKVKIKEIVANFTYIHEESIPESRCPRCRKTFEFDQLRTFYL